jgi:hypothetical protein
MANDCMDPPKVIARSDPDPELTALYAELRRRYPTADLYVYRQIRDDGGPSHLSISINGHDSNRRISYSLGTDTADRALCCIDEWERSLAASTEPPPRLYAACCRRCGDPISAAQAGLSRIDLHHAKCPKCPEGTKTDIFSYVLSGDE